METFAVWETEYPDEGSRLARAWTEKGACRKYRRATRERGAPSDMTPLSTAEMNHDTLAERLLLNGHEEIL